VHGLHVQGAVRGTAPRFILPLNAMKAPEDGLSL
jgi:hypothetical protein